MADTGQDKTEAPTPRRRNEARSRGQIGKSSDLTAAVVLLGALLILNWTGRDMLTQLVELTRRCLGDTGPDALDPGALALTAAGMFRRLTGMVLPIMLGATALALVASFLQVGFVFTLVPLTPSLDKLNPVNGLNRMFNTRAVVHLMMGLAKMSLLALVAWWTLHGRMDVLAHASALPHLSIVAVASELAFTLGLRLATTLLILAIIDFIYQRWKTEQDLKMTKEEVKEELKRMDGDPMIKRRRREIQLQLAMQRIRAAVPKADVVVTNPTELAVVIQYDASVMNAPRVTAKGADLLAKRIRELAIEHGVPIVERKPLAQALYRTVEVGQEIPAQFFKAVAEILAYVYELSGRRGTRRRAAAGVSMN
ncbi:MAG: flagellar biosynthetic protein FlhB [Phycisphaerae bacterium]